MYMSFHCTLEYAQSTVDCRRLRFSSDADIVRLTNARIIIIIIIIIYTSSVRLIIKYIINVAYNR